MNFEQSKLLDTLPKQFFANLVAKVNKKIGEGVDVINLGQGNPDKPTPDYIVKSAQKWVTDPQTHKYSLFRGLPAFKEAAANFYQEKYGADFDPEKEVAILGGSKIGLVELPWALMNPGDTFLLPDPGYPDYLSGAALGEVNFETVPLLAENNFLPDLKAIPEEVAQRAKFFYLNYPNNPTGAVATPEFYRKLVAWAKKYHVGIISDFAYGAIGFDGQAPVSFMETPDAKDVGIEFYTFSKTFNMAGWRIAFAVGNADIIEALNLIQDHYAFINAAEKIGWHAFTPQGTFYAWMPVPKGYTSESFADLLLDKAGVAVAPGNGFGKHGEGYVRIGLLIEPARLTEAVERIAKLNLFN